MFKKLGEFITRKPWVIIALWAIIVLILTPFAATLSDSLQYSAAPFMPKDTDSSKAQDIYKELFSKGNASKLIVIVDSGDPARARAFINALNTSVHDNKSLKKFNGTSSIYGMQREVLFDRTPELHKGLVEAQDNVSDANKKLYEGIDGVRNASDGLYGLWDNITNMNDQFNKARRQIRDASGQLYAARDQAVQGHGGLYLIKDTVDVIIGVPTHFVSEYVATNSSLDDAVRSGIANDRTKDYVSGTFSGPTRDMATQYLAEFYAYWSGDYIADPAARAEDAIKSAGPGYLNGLPASLLDHPISDYPADERDYCVDLAAGMQNLTDPAQKQMLYALYDLGPVPSPAAIDGLVVGMATAKGGDRNAIEGLYGLGRNPPDGVIGNYLVDRTIATIRDSDEGRNMSRPDLQNMSDIVHDAWNLGPMATKQDFDNYVLNKAKNGLNASESEIVQEIWDMGPHPDESAIVDFALVRAAEKESMNETQLQAARDIIALGRNASNDSIQRYLVSETMKNMNLTGNDSYYLALLSLDRNASNESLMEFGAEWAETHDYDNPRLFPGSLTQNLISGSLTLFVVTISADDVMDQYLVADDIAILRGLIRDVQEKDGFNDVSAYVTGTGAMSADTKKAAKEDLGNIDKFTILLVVVLLLIYFRSVLTPFVPLLAIGIAIAATMGAIGIVSHFISIYYVVELFTVVIMLGAGIDYCVFMLSRYSEERRHGADVKDAVVATVEHAGKSIVSSGMTAALSFSSLALIGTMFPSIGLGVSIGLIISVAMCVTLVPAVLTLAGDRIFWPNKLYGIGNNATVTGIWGGIVKKVVRHAKVITVLAVLISVPAVALTIQLETGMDTVKMLPANVESGTGYALLQDAMGSGALSRAMITITLPMYINDSSGERSPEAMGRVEAISAMVATVPGVDMVYSMTRPDGERINYTSLDDYKGIEKEYYEMYMDNSTGNDNRTTLIYASFKGSPFSLEAYTAIDTMRTMLRNNSSGALQGTEVHVGGDSAVYRDIQGTMENGFLLVIPIVVFGIMAILLALLKSALTPVRIIMTLGMSIFWTMAAYVVVFQYGMGSIMVFLLPTMLFISLMGLGVDYDIFLVTRIREETLKGLDNEAAIVKAVDRTGTIITLCGAVMAGAFGTLMLSSQLEMQQLGFIMFVAVAIDATVMRLVIVPAVMKLMGKYNWWMPGRKEKAEPPMARVEKP